MWRSFPRVFPGTRQARRDDVRTQGTAFRGRSPIGHRPGSKLRRGDHGSRSRLCLQFPSIPSSAASCLSRRTVTRQPLSARSRGGPGGRDQRRPARFRAWVGRWSLLPAGGVGSEQWRDVSASMPKGGPDKQISRLWRRRGQGVVWSSPQLCVHAGGRSASDLRRGGAWRNRLCGRMQPRENISGQRRALPLSCQGTRPPAPAFLPASARWPNTPVGGHMVLPKRDDLPELSINHRDFATSRSQGHDAMNVLS